MDHRRNSTTFKTPGPLWGGLLLAACFYGCQGDQPVNPSRVVSLTVSIPKTNELRASLLGASSNELLYRVEGSGMNPIKATLGPFSTAASPGDIAFTVEIPGGGKRLLSLQLNDAGTHQPLAIGATEVNFAAPVPDVVVEMGSVTRNCYFVDEKLGANGNNGSTYGFSTDTLFNQLTSGGATYDVAVSLDAGTSAYQFVDAQATSTGALSSIAFLGKGNLVDHDRVPPNSSYFFVSSGAAKQYAIAQGFAPASATTEVEAGDIYFLDLSTIPGAHAWVQVTDPGLYSAISVGYGPSWRFRVNSSLPYYAYGQTSPDLKGSCGLTW